MLSDKRWQDKWRDLRARGIDGFKVGVPSGEHPDAVYFDCVCDLCGSLIEKNNWSSRPIKCFNCKEQASIISNTLIMLHNKFTIPINNLESKQIKQ